MLFFPLPFLTAFFLILVIIQLARYIGRGLDWVVLLTVTGFALQSVLLGISWGFHDMPKLPLISLAIALPPLTWLSLNELAGRARHHSRAMVFGGLAGLIGVNAVAFLLGNDNIVDALSIMTYLLFGGHLVWSGMNLDLDWMASRPLQSLIPTQRAYMVAGIILLISAGVDVMVALDIRLNDSQISPALVGYSNLTFLLALIVVFFMRHDTSTVPLRPQPSTITSPTQSQEDETSAESILAKLDLEMETNHLYRNESLSLNEIARKIRVPARQVSSAVNTLRAMNVPKYVNTFRIRDACRILEETDMPVTEVIFAVGFTTKSNFNREFQRVTGLNPSEWRSRACRAAEQRPQTDPIRMHERPSES
ncbi:AraC family transcriptional regulator [Phaeobacter sp.]|uniref:helix-turn-helix domain-containing protein n=1 Tax=Phaeobacter sp. TaxID=1902409 RepID=UPI0025D6A7F8|nr:AraC family transcriptional regulator [Phaeobacter sp.]